MDQKPEELTKSQKIQNDFSKVCMQIGDLEFKLHALKEAQIELNKAYKQAMDEEKAQAPAPESKVQ